MLTVRDRMRTPQNALCGLFIQDDTKYHHYAVCALGSILSAPGLYAAATTIETTPVQCEG